MNTVEAKQAYDALPDFLKSIWDYRKDDFGWDHNGRAMQTGRDLLACNLIGLHTYLSALRRSVLRHNPGFGCFWPPNIAMVLYDMGITTPEAWEAFNTTLSNLPNNIWVGVKPHVFNRPPIESLENAHQIVVKDAVKDQCHFSNNITWVMGDAFYALPEKSFVQEVLKYNSIDSEPYITMSQVDVNITSGAKGDIRYIHDCDNFARSLSGRFSNVDLAGLSFGECHVVLRHEIGDGAQGAHAINIFMDADHKIWLIEPQSDRIYTPKHVFTALGGIKYHYELYWVSFV